MAKIEKELYDWANDVQGIMIKKERDTFVFIFEQKFLDKMKEEKFAILDKIKEIRNEENLQITLSIAISNEGNTNYEKYQSATDAMDIALGRGGDQTVIKTDGKYVEICDRKEAIRYAVDHAEVGDVIVLAGKGHEDYQEIKGVKYDMDERVLIAEVVKESKRENLIR